MTNATIDRSTRTQQIAIAASALVALTLFACDPATPTAEAPIKDARVIGEVGLAPGQFNYPRAIAAAHTPEGPVLWTIDKSARIQRINPRSARADLVFETPIHDNGKPCGLSLGPMPGAPGTPALYVADTHYYRVLVYDLSTDPPTLAHTFGDYGTAPGQFIYPTDVAVLTDAAGGVDRIYVTEYGGNDRVTVFDASFEPLSTFGTLGVLIDDVIDATDVAFNRPQSIAIRPASGDRDRELVIVDACNHRVGRFTLDGDLIAWFGHASPSRELGAVNYPYGLALLDDDTALVTEFGAGRIQQFDLETGEAIGVFGAPGRLAGELARPWAIDVIDGVAYVLDSGNNRILAFDAPADAATPAIHLADRAGARP
ncbi:MAG: hypothetical protein AAGK04_12305 [Planctomycetota bacterium]